MILSLPLNMMIFWQSLSCAAATVLLFFLFKVSLHRSSGRLHWFLAVRIDKDSINHCNVWICVILTIGHPEHFLHATHLGNILSNIPLFATNRPGLPVGTPVVGASKHPQSYSTTAKPCKCLGAGPCMMEILHSSANDLQWFFSATWTIIDISIAVLAHAKHNCILYGKWWTGKLNVEWKWKSICIDF